MPDRHYFVRVRLLLLNSFARLLSFGLVSGMSEEKPSTETMQEQKSLSEADVHQGKGVDADEKVPETEVGGFEKRPEPTRFGDWEVNGRCSDF